MDTEYREQIAAALSVKDHARAAKLLSRWKAKDPKNPWLRLQAAQLQEQTQRLEAAEKNYRHLLQQTSQQKLISQARAGLLRIQQAQAKQAEAEQAAATQVKQQELEAARQAGSNELSLLAIAPPNPNHRTQAAQAFAKLFDLDPYTARLKLPNKGLRLYRVSPHHELTYFAQQLRAAGIPNQCARVSDIKSISTFHVQTVEALGTTATVLCKNNDRQLGKISFDWQEVRCQVRGQLPVFEQVIDLGPRGRTVHKERIQDYVQVFDLYLPGRQTLLRLCDRTYQYRQGIALTPPKSKPERNSRIQWNTLLERMRPYLGGPTYEDFDTFGNDALDFIALLPAIPTNLDLNRRSPSDWDLAFHLYSTLMVSERTLSKAL